MRTSWVLLCAGLAMVAGVWQKTNEGLAAEVQHQKQRSKHTILVEGPGHTEKEVIMPSLHLSLDDHHKKEIVRLATLLQEPGALEDMIQFESDCLESFEEDVCNFLIKSALPYSSISEEIPRPALIMAMKAASCVITLLVIVICIFGHVESNKRIAENAVDSKYHGVTAEEQPDMSHRVRGVAKIDFHGNEVYSEVGQSVNDLFTRSSRGALKAAYNAMETGWDEEDESERTGKIKPVEE